MHGSSVTSQYKHRYFKKAYKPFICVKSSFLPIPYCLDSHTLYICMYVCTETLMYVHQRNKNTTTCHAPYMKCYSKHNGGVQMG